MVTRDAKHRRGLIEYRVSAMGLGLLIGFQLLSTASSARIAPTGLDIDIALVFSVARTLATILAVGVGVWQVSLTSGNAD